jgi:hypothetical protein
MARSGKTRQGLGLAWQARRGGTWLDAARQGPAWQALA